MSVKKRKHRYLQQFYSYQPKPENTTSVHHPGNQWMIIQLHRDLLGKEREPTV